MVSFRRDVSIKALTDNAELTSLSSILGLEFGKNYEDSIKELRYGRVMLMTDQDTDGSHIKVSETIVWGDGLFVVFFPCQTSLTQLTLTLLKKNKSGTDNELFSLFLA